MISFCKLTYMWVNYNDLTTSSLESWLVRGIIPKWPYFMLVKYYDLPRYMWNIVFLLCNFIIYLCMGHFHSTCIPLGPGGRPWSLHVYHWKVPWRDVRWTGTGWSHWKNTAWWFGTWLLFYFSIYWESHHPNWRTHIFQRSRYTTNQNMKMFGSFLWRILCFSLVFHWCSVETMVLMMNHAGFQEFYRGWNSVFNKKHGVLWCFMHLNRRHWW